MGNWRVRVWVRVKEGRLDMRWRGIEAKRRERVWVRLRRTECTDTDKESNKEEESAKEKDQTVW
jgi:hypothetical protein